MQSSSRCPTDCALCMGGGFGTPKCYGLASSQAVSLAEDGESVKFEYTGGDGGASTQITVTCDKKMDKEAAPTWTAESLAPADGTLRVVGKSAAVCFPIGISGGWVFIIILFVSTILYFLAGTVYKAKVKGAAGVEAVPNIDFWRDLPSLVKDGVSFCVGLVRGGGSAPSKAGYTEA